jgi:hypothetical protein
MLSDDDLGAVKLPPKPGVETGLPRPPRAPVDPGSGEGGGEKKEQYKPSPPAGQGPVLEWYKGSRRGSIAAAFGGMALIIVGVTFKQGGSLEWLSLWWIWPCIAVLGLLIGLSVRASSCSAGAEWFARNKTWVRTYELTSIKVKTPANYRQLHLEDKDGRKMNIKLLTAQENQELWDLVYNGIRHSVIDGRAETNGLARRALRLPKND